MKDYVRAAMTCIQLYRNNSYTFKGQSDLANLLLTAVRHLEEEMSFDGKLFPFQPVRPLHGQASKPASRSLLSLRQSKLSLI